MASNRSDGAFLPSDRTSPDRCCRVPRLVGWFVQFVVGIYGGFFNGGAVSWPEATVMLVAVGVGGWFGVEAARRLPSWTVRGFMIAVGLVLTVYYDAA